MLCASAEGIINIFSWDFFGDCNDRIVGHPGSIDCMIKYDESTIITGCEDGLIRAVSVLPNKIISIISDPLDAQDDGFHIQKLTLSHNNQFLASCTLDDMVKIVDVANLGQRERDEDEANFDEEAYEQQVQERNFKTGEDKRRAKEEERKAKGEDAEMDGEGEGSGGDSGWEDSSDDDSDSSDDDGKKEKKKNKKLNPKNATLHQSKKMIQDQ